MQKEERRKNLETWKTPTFLWGLFLANFNFKTGGKLRFLTKRCPPVGVSPIYIYIYIYVKPLFGRDWDLAWLCCVGLLRLKGSSSTERREMWCHLHGSSLSCLRRGWQVGAANLDDPCPHGGFNLASARRELWRVLPELLSPAVTLSDPTLKRCTQ